MPKLRLFDVQRSSRATEASSAITSWAGLCDPLRRHLSVAANEQRTCYIIKKNDKLTPRVHDASGNLLI